MVGIEPEIPKDESQQIIVSSNKGGVARRLQVERPCKGGIATGVFLVHLPNPRIQFDLAKFKMLRAWFKINGYSKTHKSVVQLSHYLQQLSSQNRVWN